MPRPTKKRRLELDEMRRLQTTNDALRSQINTNLTIITGLRADLAGADRANKGMQETITLMHSDADRDARQLMDAQTRYHTLLREHQKVCMMFASMASQFDSVEVRKDEMPA